MKNGGSCEFNGSNRKNMNCSLRSVICSVLLFVNLFTQAQYAFKEYAVPEKIASRYDFSPDGNHTRLTNYAKLTKKDFNAFSQTCIYNKYNVFISGRVYLEWNEVENYLNAVLTRILPDSLKNKLHAYPYRSTASNAFTLPDGSIFVNIGLLSEMDDEAQLAVILGHEAAHYIHHDHHFSHKKNLESVRINGDNEKELMQFENAHENREQEKAADFLGFELAKDAGYNISSAVPLFQTMNYSDIMDERKKRKSRLTLLKPDRQKTEELLQTHPELKDRIEYLLSYSKKIAIKEANRFIVVDENNFLMLTNVAKHQNLAILMENSLYKRCIQFALVYHLADPEGIEPLYFLAEALRRFIYTDVKMEDAGFLTDDDHSGAFGPSEGIFQDLTRLFVDSIKYQRIKNNLHGEYESAPGTYKQAFDFFIKKAIKKNSIESYLTLALAAEDSVDFRKNIRTYLQFPNAVYNEYAQALLSNELETLLKNNTKEMVLCSSIDFVKLNRNEAVVQYEKSEKESEKFFDALSQSVKLYSQKEVVSINSLIYADFAMAQKINNCTSAMIYAYHPLESKVKTESYYNIKKQKDVNIFIISPEYWMFFKENKLRSLEFYHAVSINSKRGENFRVNYYSYNTSHLFPTSSKRILEVGKLNPKEYSVLFKRCTGE